MMSKVAVIGCGAWGRNLVRNFYNLGALATIVEPNVDIRDKLALEYAIEPRELQDVLDDPHIEGVVVALPARHHYAIAVDALKAGKHVYIEKPMTLSYADAQALADLADQHNRMIMVGHLPRYHPAFQRLVELVGQGEVGEVTYVYSHRLSLGRIRGDENCLWDLAPHDISMVLAVTGQEPAETHTHASSCLEPSLVDTAMVHMSFSNGMKAHIYNSWMHPFKEHRFVVIGRLGMIVFDDCQPWESKLMVYHHKIQKLNELDYVTEMVPGVPIPIEPSEPLKLECQHFLDCITNKSTPLTDASEGVRVMKVLEQIQQLPS
jgi:UDP-2-acetamido-3-amino-2,3-dideoxy-glucuronate N-acetyltransferase